MSKSLQNIQDDFNNAILVNTSKLTPQQAGTKEIFTFSPKLFTKGPKYQPEGEAQENHRIYVAIRAIDRNSLKSAVSNIAQASLFIPPNSAPVLARDRSKPIVKGHRLLRCCLRTGVLGRRVAQWRGDGTMEA